MRQPRRERRKRKRQVPEYSARESWMLYRRLLGYVVPHRGFFALSVLGYLIFALTSVATAEWLGWTVDQVTAGNSDARVLAAVLCVTIVLVRGIGSFLGTWSIAHVGNHIVHTLRCQILDQLLRLPVRFYDNSTVGRLVSKVTYDVAQITGAATNAVTIILREGMTVIGLLVALFWTNWQLSLVFLLVTPGVALAVSVASKRFRKYSRQMQDSMGDVTHITSESIKGQKVVRTFNATDFVARRFSVASNKNRRENMKMIATQAVSTPLIQLIVSVAMAALIWFAMSPGLLAAYSAGQFVTFLTLASLLAKPIRQLTQVNSVIQRGLSAAGSIFALLDEKQEADTGTHEAETIRGKVVFDDVSFSYRADARSSENAANAPTATSGAARKGKRAVPALSNISFTAEPGQSIALVGKSGSGKSTLVNLLPRYYEADGGSITLDDVELTDYTLKNLRQHISVVSQQVVLFEGTIAENIAYGDTGGFDDARIIEVAENAHAMEFIRDLPQGIHTQVGDDAALLSGGQRQRIAIARAFYKNSPILILDEATSALDSESEQHIQIALNTLMKGRTTFVIAHRLSTIESADMILVMQKGRIVERGRHDELIALGKHYAKLHKVQFSDTPVSDTAISGTEGQENEVPAETLHKRVSG